VERWWEAVERVEGWLDRIQSRGGRVVFVRLPSQGELWDLHSRRYPRERYWDLWAGKSDAAFVHFKDIPGMSAFDLPDLSHLDQRDAPIFTRLLLVELRRQGFFDDGLH
jgi:hypothetical protein